MAGSYSTVINLYLGDMEFVNCTENMVSIDHNRIAANVSSSTVIEVYDDTALVVDAAIANLSDNKISFEYGYVNGAMSERYEATITKYSTEFIGFSAICTIECVSTGVVSSATGDDTTTSKTYNGNISDIVYQVASEESWDVGKIEATEYKNFSVTRNTESASDFIESLILKAISAETGKGDYKFSLEDKNGRSVVYFATEINIEDLGEEIDEETVNPYEYQYVLGMPNENIISFTPQYNEVLAALVGANAVTGTAMDPETNEVVTVDVGNQQEAGSVELERAEGSDIKKVKRYVGGNSYSYDELTSIAQNLYEVASSLSYKASLSLKGKPRITPNTKISILVLTREGQRHHSSGSYLIISVDDLVENGTYTTTLDLYKNIDDVSQLTVTTGGNYTLDGSTGYTGGATGNYESGVNITRNIMFSGNGKNTMEYLVLHTSVGPGASAQSIANAVKNQGLSVHGVIHDTGVLQTAEFDAKCAHCGNGNSVSIGFEQTESSKIRWSKGGITPSWDSSDNETVKAYHEKLYANAVGLFAYLGKTYNIPTSKMISHKEIAAKFGGSDHADPEALWDKFRTAFNDNKWTMDAFRANVQQAMNNLQSSSTGTGAWKETNATCYGNTAGDDNGVNGWNGIKYHNVSGNGVAIPIYCIKGSNKYNANYVQSDCPEFAKGYGTIVEIKNPANGKSCTAIVADCGNFGPHAKYNHSTLLDLQPNTQRALGIWNSTTKVQYRVIGHWTKDKTNGNGPYTA